MDESDALNEIENLRSKKDIGGLIEILRNATISRKIRRKSALALQSLYFTGGLDERSKGKIKEVEWLLTKMVVDIEKKKSDALERANNWWEGKPDPAGDGALYICDVCNREIRQKEGTSLLGSYMRCASCTERMFERWDKGED
jgi:hypothetical protein